MNRRFMELAILGALVAATAAQAQDQDQRQRDRAYQAQAQRQESANRQRDRRIENNAIQRQNQRQAQDFRRDAQENRRDRVLQNQAANRRFMNFQRNVQATRRFRGGYWRPPVGYNYRRWSWGERLPFGFYVRDYWINNWAAFALFAPPPGLVWVRYGPDALLIDPSTGEIIQVRYGVFY